MQDGGTGEGPHGGGCTPGRNAFGPAGVGRYNSTLCERDRASAYQREQVSFLSVWGMTVGKAIVVIVVIAAMVGGGYLALRGFSRRCESDDPLISIVFLLRAPRPMREAGVRSAAGKAFNVTFDADDPHATTWVVPAPSPAVEGLDPKDAQSFMVNVPQGAFVVNNFAVPYMAHPDEFAAGISDRRLRGAIAAHRAWVSVDAMGDLPDEASKAEAYRAIGKMLAELAGPDCLAVYCPELERCNEYDEALVKTLRGDDPLAVFEEPTFGPVIDVDSEDPRLVAAIEEARRRWPEFVAAFNVNADKERPFLVKAKFEEGETVEHMWISVTRVDGDTIHGVLENEPHGLTKVKQGQAVALPLSALSDWLYAKGKEPVGGFTAKVIAEMEKGE